MLTAPLSVLLAAGSVLSTPISGLTDTLKLASRTPDFAFYTPDCSSVTHKRPFSTYGKPYHIWAISTIFSKDRKPDPVTIAFENKAVGYHDCNIEE